MTTTVQYDYCIIGAGPAGLQLAYFLEQRKLSYIVLEAGEAPGEFFRRFPRHRRLISNNKVHTGISNPDTNLRWDWNSLLCEDEKFLFKNYSTEYFPPADSLLEYLKDFATRFRLNVRYGTKVTRVRRAEGFILETSEGEFRAPRLIMATGKPKLQIPHVPGIELGEPYDRMSVNPADFVNQRVLILGKGNSGMETAENLIGTTAVIHVLSPNPVRMAWRTHYVGDLRAVNNNVLDTYQLKSQNTIIDATLEKIERMPDGQLRASFLYTHAEGERRAVLVDRVLICTGFGWDPSFFDKDTCLPEGTPCGRFPKMTSAWESTNIPELFYAGTLMHMRDYRKSFSGFIHGFRYNVELLARIFDWKHRGSAFPSRPLPAGQEPMLETLMARVNTTSSLFQQPGFLADVIVRGEDGQTHYYQDLTTDLIDDHKLFGGAPYLTVTMEYGHQEHHPDPFSIHRVPTDGTRSTFIHPVIRLRHQGKILSEHHVPEDLENTWSTPAQLDPVRRYLETVRL